MANIAVIGTGYVGLVSGACLADFGNTVTCVDIDKSKIEALKKGTIPIYEPGLADVAARNTTAKRLLFTDSLAEAVSQAQVIFITVGTPPLGDGSVDLSYVENVSRQIGRVIESYKVIVDKSTVPIGTARKVISWIKEETNKRTIQVDFDVVSNPEFLREGAAVQDFTHPDRIVIGAETERARNIMKDVYRSLYLNETPYIETNLESAEMIKYAANSFLAVKIAYINEIANLCEKVGADVKDVAIAMGRDGRIGTKFLHPGPGYGGSCFPKDTRAFAKTGQDAGQRLSIVESAISANESQKQLQVEKIENVFGGNGSLRGKTAAILGLSYKPNTDDVRESPSIDICSNHVTKGMKLRVYDPAATQAAQIRLSGIKNSLYFASDEYDAVKGCDALIIITEWNQFRNLELKKIKDLLTQPYFFDFRNIYSREQTKAAGLKHFCTGR